MFRADRLVQLMDSRGLSKSELARRVGVSPTTIWKLTTEPVQGSKYTHRIAFELGTTAAYLMDETEDSASEAPDDHFSSDERDWINILRDLDAKNRAAILQIARSLPREEKGATLHSPSIDYRAG